MEEGEEHVQRFEAVDHAAGLPPDAAGVLRDTGGGQRLGEGGEEDAPPHRRTVEHHGQQTRQNRYEQFISQFHDKNSVHNGFVGSIMDGILWHYTTF